MKSRLFSLIFAALALPASATEWHLISETKEPGKVISWYVDLSSIVHEDDYMRAFLRTSWSTPQYAPDNTVYQSSTYINYFDNICYNIRHRQVFIDNKVSLINVT